MTPAEARDQAIGLMKQVWSLCEEHKIPLVAALGVEPGQEHLATQISLSVGEGAPQVFYFFADLMDDLKVLEAQMTVWALAKMVDSLEAKVANTPNLAPGGHA